MNVDLSSWSHGWAYRISGPATSYDVKRKSSKSRKVWAWRVKNLFFFGMREDYDRHNPQIYIHQTNLSTSIHPPTTSSRHSLLAANLLLPLQTYISMPNLISSIFLSSLGKHPTTGRHVKQAALARKETQPPWSMARILDCSARGRKEGWGRQCSCSKKGYV